MRPGFTTAANSKGVDQSPHRTTCFRHHLIWSCTGFGTTNIVTSQHCCQLCDITKLVLRDTMCLKRSQTLYSGSLLANYDLSLQPASVTLDSNMRQHLSKLTGACRSLGPTEHHEVSALTKGCHAMAWQPAGALTHQSRHCYSAKAVIDSAQHQTRVQQHQTPCGSEVKQASAVHAAATHSQMRETERHQILLTYRSCF